LLGHDEYLQCSIDIMNITRPGTVDLSILQNVEFGSLSRGFLKSILKNISYGFTISFLAKPHFYKEQGPMVFLSIGEPDEEPIVLLEKPIQ